MKFSQFILGILLGSISVLAWQKLPLQPSGKVERRAAAFTLNDNTLLLYGGRYGFSSREGEIASILSGIEFEKDVLKGASVVIPSGAVLVAVKDKYLVGYYEGKVHIEKNDGSSQVIDKVFFYIHADNRLEFSYPSEKSNFPGKNIEGKVTFY